MFEKEKPVREADDPNATGKAVKPLPLWLTCAAVGVAAGIFTQIFPIGNPPPVAATRTVVILDTGAIAEAKAASTLAKSSADPSFIGREAGIFADQMKRVIAGYTERGVVVINNHSAISWPADADITQAVATQLGVDLNTRMPASAIQRSDNPAPQALQNLPQPVPVNATVAPIPTAPGALRP